MTIESDKMESDLIHIVPLNKKIHYTTIENLDRISNILLGITKKCEPKIKNLELALKSTGNLDKKKSIELLLNQTLEKWYHHCQRLGGTPVGVFKCKFHLHVKLNPTKLEPSSENAEFCIYWEYPHGLIQNK